MVFYHPPRPVLNKGMNGAPAVQKALNRVRQEEQFFVIENEYVPEEGEVVEEPELENTGDIIPGIDGYDGDEEAGEDEQEIITVSYLN